VNSCRVDAVGAIVIPNHYEFNLLSYGLASETGLSSLATGSRALTDAALLWGGDGKRVYLPGGFSAEWVQFVASFMGYRRVEVLPVEGKGTICRELALSNEIKCFKGNEKILAWGATPQLHALLSSFNGSNSFDITDFAGVNALPVARYLDSKGGCRLTFSRKDMAPIENLALKMAEGYLLPDLESAAAAAAEISSRYGYAVVKANHGVGGLNVAILSGEGESIAGRLAALSRWDPLWRQTPLIVEALIGGRSITADWFLSKCGAAELVGVGEMRIERGSRYRGVFSGRGVISAETLKMVSVAGKAITDKVYRRGYSGWVNGDFILSDEGSLYLSEINMRRSSPTHAFEGARHLKGAGWAEKTALATDEHLAFIGGPPEAEAIIQAFERFNAGASFGQGALLTLLNNSLKCSPPYIGFAIFAGAGEELPSLEEDLLSIIKSETGIGVRPATPFKRGGL